jgi:hypothetical protein
MNICPYLRVSDIFPGTASDPDTFISILRHLSRTDALFACARLNTAFSDQADTTRLAAQRHAQNWYLETLFSRSQLELIDRFREQHGWKGPDGIFFRGQLMELFRWIVLYSTDQPNDGTTFEDPGSRCLFIQAALIASDMWGSKRAFQHVNPNSGDIEASHKQFLGPVRKSVEAGLSARESIYYLGRGWGLFVEHHQNIRRTFSEEFRLATDMSLEEYYACCVAMISMKFKDPRGYFGCPVFKPDQWSEDALDLSLLLKFIALESNTVANLHHDAQEPPDPFEFEKRLRERPILRTNDGRCIAIDPVYFGEKMAVGPLFHVLKRSPEKANEIFGHFGDAVEAYAGDILDRMFPTFPRLAKRLERNLFLRGRDGEEAEIDALLNDVTDIVVFETKAAFLREEKLLPADPSTLIALIRNKYARPKDSEMGTRAVGMAQLANAIKILTQPMIRDSNRFLRMKNIFPVMIVHDSLVSVPGWGKLLASEFQNLIRPDTVRQDSVMSVNEKIVFPPVVMCLDDLEHLQRSIENFGFLDLIKDYCSSCADRTETLHDFIASNEMYKNKMMQSGFVAEYAQKALAECMNRVFRRSQKSESPDRHRQSGVSGD